jgi:hypothetical protein
MDHFSAGCPLRGRRRRPACGYRRPVARTRALVVGSEPAAGRDNVVVALVGGIGAMGIGLMLALDLLLGLVL